MSNKEATAIKIEIKIEKSKKGLKISAKSTLGEILIDVFNIRDLKTLSASSASSANYLGELVKNMILANDSNLNATKIIDPEDKRELDAKKELFDKLFGGM